MHVERKGTLMGFKNIRTSDLSGDIIPDEKVLTVVIKGHPDLDGESKVFDTTGDELAPLKTVTGLVELEVRDTNSGQSWSQYVTKAELAKLVPDEKLRSFDNARGRRTGFRPS